MRLVEILSSSLTEMSVTDLRTAESLIERFFRDLSIDVEWSKHFVARVLDGGREEDVTVVELADAFAKMKRKYGQQLLQARNDHRQFLGVLQDIGRKLNIVFNIDFQGGSSTLPNKYLLHGITIMRKSPWQFRSNQQGGKILRVESVESRKKQKRKRKFEWQSADQAKAQTIGRLWAATAADAT